MSKTPSSVASSVANTTLNAANKVSKNISTNKIGTTDVVLNSVNNVNNHITKVRVRRFGGLSRVRVDSVNSNQLQNLKTVNTVLETVKIIKNNIGNSNISKDKLDFIKSQDIMDPISRKIVSRELFAKGINQSMVLYQKNLLQAGMKVTDPISNKTTDLFTLIENTGKRAIFLNSIDKKITSTSTLAVSDALSIMEGGLKAVNEFVTEHGTKSKMGFWVQATGGAGKLVSYGQIGIEMTTGDPRRAAGMILEEGINVAAGVATAKAINKFPTQHPIKNATAILFGALVGLGAGTTVTSQIERLSGAKKQSEKIKESMAFPNKSTLYDSNNSIITKPENINLLSPQDK